MLEKPSCVRAMDEGRGERDLKARRIRREALTAEALDSYGRRGGSEGLLAPSMQCCNKRVRSMSCRLSSLMSRLSKAPVCRQREHQTSTLNSSLINAVKRIRA